MVSLKELVREEESQHLSNLASLVGDVESALLPLAGLGEILHARTAEDK